MTGRVRLAGWAVALAAVLLLNLALHRDSGTPPPAASVPVAVASGYPSATAGLPSLAPSVSPTPGPHVDRIGPEVAAELATAVAAAREADRLGALVVGISIGGADRWTGGSGTAADGVTPLGPEDPFVIASVSKTFAATLVLELVDEGRIGLDDPVAGLLPDVSLPPGVTVRELLDHTSGIADLLDPLREQLNAHPGQSLTPQEVLAAIGPPSFPAGTDWKYSNTNYLIAALLVEAVTGQSYETALADRLLRPLGLTGTGVTGTVGAPALLPAGWASAFWGSGAMYSDVDDLLRWGDALYGGTLLPDATLARMTAFNAHDYGLGTQRLTLPDGIPAYGHSGLLKGFISLLVRVPSRQLTIVLLSTSTHVYDPMELLATGRDGGPAILDLALAAAG